MTPSVTESAILTALRSFLLEILPAGVEVIKGQANKVAEPVDLDFVVMTPTNRFRLATNIDEWDTADPAPTVITASHSTNIDIQLDIHGPNSTDNAQIIATLFRDDYGCRNIDQTIFQPLHASDGHQIPFINGEGQYEDRWVITISLQANPSISTNMDFADTVSATISPIGSVNP